MAEPISIVLGSASPQRATLLASLGVTFDVESVDLDEAALVLADDPDGTASVRRIAQAKYAALASRPGLAASEGVRHEVLLTADTLVVSGSTILGKPDCDGGVREMLTQVSGQRLVISTAVCTGRRGEQPEVNTVSTVVRLRTIDPGEIEVYVASGIGLNKAGALALQSGARPFVATLDGCWSNVLGLPLCVVASALATFLGPARIEGRMTAAGPGCSVELCGSCRR